MRIDIITAVPELLSSPFDYSIIKRAKDKGLVAIYIHNLRDYAVNKSRKIDDYAFGGGAGMVLMIEPIDNCITQLKSERDYDEIIYTSPDGQLLDQSLSNELSLKGNIIILCGHYKGVDERVREYLIMREISIGNYVLSGGELATAVIVDSIVRLLPKVLSDETSALSDSFQDGLIAPPIYTRPSRYKSLATPSILLSGDANKIEEWRHNKSLERTAKRRPFN